MRRVLYSGPINNHNAMRRPNSARLSASQPYKIEFVDFAFGVGIAFQDVTTADKLASCLSHRSLASLPCARNHLLAYARETHTPSVACSTGNIKIAPLITNLFKERDRASRWTCFKAHRIRRRMYRYQMPISLHAETIKHNYSFLCLAFRKLCQDHV